MDIKYLGHAGFYIEGPNTILVMDPWLSRKGAYAGSWYQYPCNHHLEDFLLEKIRKTTKEVFIYISHEHQDHFDKDICEKLIKLNNVIFIIPRFCRKYLVNYFLKKGAVTSIFQDGDDIVTKDFKLHMMIHDSVREADSGLLVIDRQSKDIFVNLNDCHLHDRVEEIKKYGKIKILTGSFSGASWFPTCYTYDRKLYGQKSIRNKISRFNGLAQFLEKVNPEYYIPSAGPAVFLHDELFHLNFEENNIFPHAHEFYTFCQNSKYAIKQIKFCYLMPGELFSNKEAIPPKISYDSFKNELLNYNKNQDIIDLIKDNISNKLYNFKLANMLDKTLYLEIHSYKIIKIDFANQLVSIVDSIIDEDNYYVLEASIESWKLLNELTWYEWLLALRFSAFRKPDIFDPLLDGFLVNEAEDMEAFCNYYLKHNKNKEKIIVQDNNKEYEICRYCPHAGQDLTNAQIKNGILICPKHHWEFDLTNCGINNQYGHTIDAKEI